MEKETHTRALNDEALFHIRGYVNFKNNGYGSAKNAVFIHGLPLRDSEFGVWCAISSNNTIWIFF